MVVVDIADGSETVDYIRDAGGSAEFREGDVTEEAAMRAAFEGFDLDVLVNNAAYYAPLVTDKKRFDEISADEWDTVMAVNAKGPFLASKHALPQFGDGGSIVNISSSVVTMGVPAFLHYVASKGAVLSMTRAMAKEVGDLGIRVNAVMPGYTWSGPHSRQARTIWTTTSRTRPSIASSGPRTSRASSPSSPVPTATS